MEINYMNNIKKEKIDLEGKKKTLPGHRGRKRREKGSCE